MHPDNRPDTLRDLYNYSEPVQELALALQTKMSKLRGLDAYGTAFAGICAHLYNEETYINIEDCRSLYRQLALNGLAALMRAKELKLLCVGLAFRYESLSGERDGELGISVLVGNRREYLQIAWPDAGEPYWVLSSRTSEGKFCIELPNRTTQGTQYWRRRPGAAVSHRHCPVSLLEQ